MGCGASTSSKDDEDARKSKDSKRRKKFSTSQREDHYETVKFRPNASSTEEDDDDEEDDDQRRGSTDLMLSGKRDSLDRRYFDSPQRRSTNSVGGQRVGWTNNPLQIEANRRRRQRENMMRGLDTDDDDSTIDDSSRRASAMTTTSFSDGTTTTHFLSEARDSLLVTPPEHMFQFYQGGAGSPPPRPHPISIDSRDPNDESSGGSTVDVNNCSFTLFSPVSESSKRDSGSILLPSSPKYSRIATPGQQMSYSLLANSSSGVYGSPRQDGIRSPSRPNSVVTFSDSEDDDAVAGKPHSSARASPSRPLRSPTSQPLSQLSFDGQANQPSPSASGLSPPRGYHSTGDLRNSTYTATTPRGGGIGRSQSARGSGIDMQKYIRTAFPKSIARKHDTLLKRRQPQQQQHFTDSGYPYPYDYTEGSPPSQEMDTESQCGDGNEQDREELPLSDDEEKLARTGSGETLQRVPSSPTSMRSRQQQIVTQPPPAATAAIIANKDHQDDEESDGDDDECWYADDAKKGMAMSMSIG